MSDGINQQNNMPPVSSKGSGNSQAKSTQSPSGKTGSNKAGPKLKGTPKFNPPWLKGPSSKNLVSWILLGMGAILLVTYYTRPDIKAKEVAYSEFIERIESGEIQRVVVATPFLRGYLEREEADIRGLFKNPSTYYVANQVNDPDIYKLLKEKGVRFEAENVELKNFFWHWVVPFLVLLLLWRMLFSRAMRMGPGAGIMSFGKNRARLVEDENKKVTFADVAGVEEAKEELCEIVEFLKTPQKFRSIGGKIPKGILLVGPPGTGKTLLARAVAGEAGVPFFSLSGSEFVEMFVGVGAARVRDLFAQAVEKSPCIIFIDELDAIGKVRSAVSPLGGHDEREQTLNQLLVEMDGFDTKGGVIIMGATNRPETLDPALMRPGRFDRQVFVDRPDVKGREAILRIHAKNVKTDPKLDLNVVAARTPGFAGADLANVVNEAALLAVRKNKQMVELSDFDDAIDRVIAGLQKKSRLINSKEKQIVAIHEMGHALVTHFTKDTDPVHKVSIIPRGFALGVTMNLPKEDRYLMTQPELLARIDILFGGRVAEQVVFGEISTGAQDDLQKATDLATRMVTDYGMSEAFGQRTFGKDRSSFIPGGPMSFQKEYSETAAEKIDEEIQKILGASYERVVKLLKSKIDLLKYAAHVLSDKEVIEGHELTALVAEFEHKAVADKSSETQGYTLASPEPKIEDKPVETPPSIS